MVSIQLSQSPSNRTSIYLRINGSLARRAVKDLMTRGSIRMISAHSRQQMYSRATIT